MNDFSANETWDKCYRCGELTESITTCRTCFPMKPLDKDRFKEVLRDLDEQLSRLRRNIETCNRIREERMSRMHANSGAERPPDNREILP